MAAPSFGSIVKPLAHLLEVPATAMVVQVLASLLAILVLAWIAHKLRLGGDARILGEDQARALADAALCGFDPAEMAIDRAGIGAIFRDRQGRVLLVRRHGSHFAARQITSHAGVRLDGRFLTLSTDDRQFGTITLDLGEQASVWAASLRRLGAGLA